MNELSLFNSLFDDLDAAYSVPTFNYKKVFHSPKVDVKEDESAYTLEMDLPGKTEKDVKIELNNNVLTIESETEEKNEKKEEKDEKKTKWLLRERSFSKFSRSFTLPEDVDSEKLSASVKNGVLAVTMPRKALPQPRRIQISYGA